MSKDGCICVGLAIKDIDHLEKLSQALESSNPIKLRSTVSKGVPHPACFLRFYNKHMVDTLQYYGITPAKSLTVKPCSAVPPELSHHYWRGIFDGDGSFAKHTDTTARGYHWGINLIGSVFVVSGFRDWVVSAGAYSTKIDQIGNCARIDYGKLTTVQFIADKMYNDASVFLERKRCRYEEIMATPSTQLRHAPVRFEADLGTLQTLYGELKTWNKVARHLGISISSLASNKALLLASRAA